MGIFMNLEKIMEQYRQETEITPDEKSIQDTVHKAKQAFFQKEQERGLTYWEFLLKQLQVIRKRWWLLQILLLAAAEVFFSVTQEEYYIRKGSSLILSGEADPASSGSSPKQYPVIYTLKQIQDQ